MSSNDPEQSETPKGTSSDGAESLGETVLGGDTSTSPPGASPNEAAKWVGRRLGKYDITGILGAGGMGVVLKAHDATIGRDVAIKVLPSELSADHVLLNRFLDEAKSAGKLNHPNTVTIHEVARDGQTHYLVMELATGASAEEHLKQHGAFAPSEATRIVVDACRGVAAAHKAGIVHRDIKPANLLLTDDGSVKVSDFGLAKRVQSQSMQLTRDGHVVGTPYYMSPEQCEARPVDTRSDIYSLGATYYSLLTGHNPYEESGSVVQVMYAHCNAAPPDPREVRANVPAACAQIIERAMAKKPEQRYQSMDEMRSDLEALLAAMSGANVVLPSTSAAHAVQSTASPAAGRSGRPPWAAVAGTIAILILAAIAGYSLFGDRDIRGTPEGSSPDNGEPAVITPASGEPIRVGILHSLTGTMASSESPVVDAALLAIEELNREGGVLGRPVEAVVADGRSDPAVFAREAKRLIDDEDVCTVFGCWTSACRKTVVPVFEELDHLLVYPVQYEGLEESPNVIYTGAAPNQQILPALKWAYAFEGRRRFFLVGSDYVFPRVAFEIVTDQLRELGGELVGAEFLPLGTTDVQPVVEKIVEAQPDVILNFINGDTNTAFFARLRRAGITPQTTPTISFSIGEEELRHLDLSAVTGDYCAWNYFQSIDSAENDAFVSSFRAKYGPQRVITDPMEASYFGIKLWAQAVAAAESTDVNDIRRAMRNQRLKAPHGEVRIDPATQHTFKTARIGRVKPDGQFEVVWTAARPEAPMPYPASRTTAEWRALLHDLYTGWGDQWSAPEN